MKKVLNTLCALITIAYGITAIIVAVNVFSEEQVIYQWFMQDNIMDIRLYLNIPVFYFLVYNIITWNKYDKKPLNLVFLIVLNIFFMPIYYIQSIRKAYFEQNSIDL